MRKSLLIISLVLVISLSACGGNSVPTKIPITTLESMEVEINISGNPTDFELPANWFDYPIKNSGYRIALPDQWKLSVDDDGNDISIYSDDYSILIFGYLSAEETSLGRSDSDAEFLHGMKTIVSDGEDYYEKSAKAMYVANNKVFYVEYSEKDSPREIYVAVITPEGREYRFLVSGALMLNVKHIFGSIRKSD